MKNIFFLILLIPTAFCLSGMTFMPSTLNENPKMEKQKNYYCEYCGHKFSSVRQLTSGTCPRHPDGSNKGRHKLYEGSEKSEYTCKYCGKKFRSIQVMVSGQCVNHPNGSNKGYHAPAL